MADKESIGNLHNGPPLCLYEWIGLWTFTNYKLISKFKNCKLTLVLSLYLNLIQPTLFYDMFVLINISILFEFFFLFSDFGLFSFSFFVFFSFFQFYVNFKLRLSVQMGSTAAILCEKYKVMPNKDTDLILFCFNIIHY